MSARIEWIDERRVGIVTSDAEWEVPMRYDYCLIVFSDGTLVEASRKGGVPRIHVLVNSGDAYETSDEATDETGVVISGDVSWFARAWDYHSLAITAEKSA